MTPDQSRRLLRTLVGICHLLLIIAAATWALSLQQSLPIIAVASAAAVVPLALGIRGLYLDKADTYRWLGLVLVLYIGFGSVEVITSQRESLSAVVMMMAALAEVLLLMSLIRNAPPTPRR
ncbi:MAG: DUF2069 domain-containing protein [Candidatus Rariloculaceae bacterium]